MSRTGGPGSPWPVAASVMLAFTVLAGGVALIGQILAPVVVLDIVALWPLSVPALVSGVLAFWRRRRSVRLLALPPLFLLTWILGSVGLHLGGWDMLPSAAADIEGPAVEQLREGTLEVSAGSGILVIAAGPNHRLYAVSMIRRGGATGAPAVGSAFEDETVRVEIAERESPGWYRSAGWSMTLSPQIAWSLQVGAADIRADLEGLSIEEGRVVGGGMVVLGSVESESHLELAGTFAVETSPDVPVRVVGSALVPGDWVSTDEGWRSPAIGNGWVITVPEGASVEIRTR